MSEWGDWQNIRGSTAASASPGALGPTQSVGGTVAFINGLYSQSGGNLSVSSAHRNTFQRGFRGRILPSDQVEIQVHAMTTPIPPENTAGLTNAYTSPGTRTWSLFTAFSNQDVGNPNNITDWQSSNTINLQTVNTTTTHNVGFWNNPTIPWNSSSAGSRSWFDSGGIVNVPSNRQDWTWFRGILGTQFGEAVQNIPTFIERPDFGPQEYRPMATQVGTQWQSLNRTNGFLQSRNASGWVDLPLLQYANAPNMNTTNNTDTQTPFPSQASSQSRDASGVWRQQSKIGSE